MDESRNRAPRRGVERSGGREMSERRLRRSPDQRMIAGVIGGLAEYFNRDAAVLRILYVFLSIFSAAFPGIIVYLILWALIPQRGDD
jgi:phage shock protein C